MKVTFIYSFHDGIEDTFSNLIRDLFFLGKKHPNGTISHEVKEKQELICIHLETGEK
jgi:hypothetical protein